MTWLTSFPRPAIIAHRGASAYAPENTLASFRLAAEMGADAIELDTKLTRDGQVVVIHDQTVDRTTGAHGKIRDFTLEELKKLDAGSHFSPAFAGEPIPTLAEVFAAVGQRLRINVELANYATPWDDTVPRVAELVHQYHLEERVFFSSFYPTNLSNMRRRLPQAPCAILAAPKAAGWLSRGMVGEWVTPEAVHPYQGEVDEPYVIRQHAKNRRVHVWTVNAESEMERLLRLGVDGLITDRPDVARKMSEGL